MGALQNAKQCQDRAARRRRVGVFPETRRFLGFFGSESQEAAVLEGNLVVGERDGPGVPYIAPERFGILAGCCNALSRGHSHTRRQTRARRANGLVPTETTKGAHHQDTVASWPPCATGAGSSKKSLWNQKWGGRSPCKGGRGPRYLHPADGLCDRWLGAITL